jgi:hypothetical protein
VTSVFFVLDRVVLVVIYYFLFFLPSPTKIQLTFLTMITRRKSSNFSPRSLLEVPNIFNSTNGPPFISLVSSLNYVVAKKIDQEGDEVANKDWGISVVEEDGIPSSLKQTMMEAVLEVPKVRRLATDQRDDGFFHRFFINRMSTDDATQQLRTESSQHVWHTDGDQTKGEQHLTCVLTLYGTELDSDSLSAYDAGGFLKLSNFDDGHYTPSSLGRPNLPKPSSTVTYYPKTNSLYIFPGYFVSHGVFKMKPGRVRYSVVMFIKLRNSVIDGVTPDFFLRREWAASNPENRKEVCHRCWSAFRTKLQVRSHRIRSKSCLAKKEV